MYHTDAVRMANVLLHSSIRTGSPDDMPEEVHYVSAHGFL